MHHGRLVNGLMQPDDDLQQVVEDEWGTDLDDRLRSFRQAADRDVVRLGDGGLDGLASSTGTGKAAKCKEGVYRSARTRRRTDAMGDPCRMSHWLCFCHTLKQCSCKPTLARDACDDHTHVKSATSAGNAESL